MDQLTAHIDLFPTWPNLPGRRSRHVASKLDGRSLVPLLKNPGAPWPDRYVFTHVGRWAKGQAAASKYAKCRVRNTRYSLVNIGPAKKWELYDLKTDPGEKNDIAAEHPDVVKRMDAAYDQWWAEVFPCLENEDAVPPKVAPVQGTLLEAVRRRPGVSGHRKHRNPKLPPRARGASDIAQ